MATMNISLPDKMKEFVEEQVATGAYANASDYVRDVLRKEQQRGNFNAYLQNAVDEAIESGFHEGTLDEFFDSVREEVAKEVKAKKSA